MTCAEAALVVAGYVDRQQWQKEIAVIAGCGPYDREGIETILGCAPKRRRSLEDEAQLVLAKARRDRRVKDVQKDEA